MKPASNFWHSDRYKWAIVGLAFCSLAFWFGVRTSFAVFYVALSSEFSWGPAALAGAQSAALIAAMAASPLIGALIDRMGARKVIIPSVLITAAGLALCRTVSGLYQFYLYYGIIAGSAVTAIGVVGYSVVIRHWFFEKRGLASGIAVSGMGVGMFVLVPVIQYGISHWGWRNAFLLLSVLGSVLLFPATLALLRNRPGNEQGCRNGPEAELGEDAFGQKPSAPETGFYGIIKIEAFWYFILFGFCASIGVYIILVHSVKFLVSEGTPPMVAATVFALVGAISSLFRIIWGWVSDRMGREFAYTLGTTSTCLGIGCLLLRHVSGAEAFNLLFAVFFGIGWGATAPSIMASSADIFDGRQYGFIFGLIQAVVNLGGALGAWLGGALYENSQSYDVAFSLAIIAFALSCLFIWRAAPRRGFTFASTFERVAVQPDRLGPEKTP